MPALSVQEAATLISCRSFETALDCSNRFIAAVSESGVAVAIDEKRRWETVLEFLFVFIHLSDRWAFEKLGLLRRDSFMDFLADSAAHSMASLLESTRGVDSAWREDIKSVFISDLNVRTIEYSKCRKVISDKETQGMQGVLLWEFGKRLAERLGHPMDGYLISLAYIKAVTGLRLLDLEGVFKDIEE